MPPHHSMPPSMPPSMSAAMDIFDFGPLQAVNLVQQPFNVDTGQLDMEAIGSGLNPLINPDPTFQQLPAVSDVQMLNQAPEVFTGPSNAKDLGTFFLGVSDPHTCQSSMRDI